MKKVGFLVLLAVNNTLVFADSDVKMKIRALNAEVMSGVHQVQVMLVQKASPNSICFRLGGLIEPQFKLAHVLKTEVSHSPDDLAGKQGAALDEMSLGAYESACDIPSANAPTDLRTALDLVAQTCFEIARTTGGK